MSIEKDIFITKEIYLSAIILSMEIDFSKWLQKEIDDRGWSWNKLAEMAGLSSGTIYNIRDGVRGVGQSSLESISRALRLPPETVFRAAGFLPPAPDTSESQEELLHLFSQLPPGEQKEMLELLRFKVERKSANINEKPPSRKKNPARSVLNN